ncbi:MAG TPA: cell division/cell wall cluster transcriptional repressor MraZ [Porticoccaceae bacterium]|nr:cell division/cell wall cluster transcriptional repressor MraZ [Porticoccaceae bacterium]
MFRGSSEINVDAKGRMAMPARYRELLEEHCDGKVVITVGADLNMGVGDKYLFIYPRPRWQEVETEVLDLASFDSFAQRLRQFFVGHARDVELDGSGRILIPPELRDYALLEKKVTLVGQIDRFELWDTGAWNRKREEWLTTPVDPSAISEQVRALRL